ncbi:MAG: hypothetical protein IPN94_14805 [Sphingobacteriales bacterium]|nr:hypothetical protein [Sphingobacteriales bacterium]
MTVRFAISQHRHITTSPLHNITTSPLPPYTPNNTKPDHALGVVCACCINWRFAWLKALL